MKQLRSKTKVLRACMKKLSAEQNVIVGTFDKDRTLCPDCRTETIDPDPIGIPSISISSMVVRFCSYQNQGL
jgi:hypothetical protein